MVIDGTAAFDAANSDFYVDNAWGAAQMALTAAQAIYDGYASDVTTYNTAAATYNTAVAAYNTAIENGDNELPEVPATPCAPTEPAAFTGLNIITKDDYTIANDVTADESYIVYESWAVGAANQLFDAARIGTLLSADNDTAGEYDAAFATTAEVSHVFGRLGQGANAAPGTAAPWRWDDPDNSDSISQYMQISVFPTGGYGFLAGPDQANYSQLTSSYITLSVSGAALSWSDLLDIPASSADAVTALTEMTGASALAASALAVAATVAALY